MTLFLGGGAGRGAGLKILRVLATVESEGMPRKAIPEAMRPDVRRSIATDFLNREAVLFFPESLIINFVY